MKYCQILASFNIHSGLIPMKIRNMAQKNGGEGWLGSFSSYAPRLYTTKPSFCKYNPINARKLGTI